MLSTLVAFSLIMCYNIKERLDALVSGDSRFSCIRKE